MQNPSHNPHSYHRMENPNLNSFPLYRIGPRSGRPYLKQYKKILQKKVTKDYTKQTKDRDLANIIRDSAAVPGLEEWAKDRAAEYDDPQGNGTRFQDHAIHTLAAEYKETNRPLRKARRMTKKNLEEDQVKSTTNNTDEVPTKSSNGNKLSPDHNSVDMKEINVPALASSRDQSSSVSTQQQSSKLKRSASSTMMQTTSNFQKMSTLNSETLEVYNQGSASCRKWIRLYRQGLADNEIIRGMGDRNMDTAINRFGISTSMSVQHFGQDCALEYQELGCFAFPNSKVPALAASGDQRKLREALKRKHEEEEARKVEEAKKQKITEEEARKLKLAIASYYKHHPSPAAINAIVTEEIGSKSDDSANADK